MTETGEAVRHQGGESMRLTVLGCGSSGGVPRPTGDWGACDPDEPRNRRSRCALMVEAAGRTAIVDVSPDFRAQMLAVGPPDRIDAVFFTHAHADQAHGIDDLRPYVLKQRARIDVYALPETIGDLTARFSYCFESSGGYPAILNACAITEAVRFAADDDGAALSVEPLPVEHGGVPGVAGYRFDAGGRRAGYVPDANDLPAASAARLEDLDLLVIDALRHDPHPSHFCLDETLEWIDRLRPRRAVLTNMHIDLDYGALARSLPGGVGPAHDGLRLTL